MHSWNKKTVALKALRVMGLGFPVLSGVWAGNTYAETALPLYPESSFSVHAWTVDDGTSFNTVMGAVRRADGYLWVATRVGLFRFDEKEFKSVPQVSNTALPGFVTPVLCEDRRGRLWLSKSSGLVACIDGANIRTFILRKGIPKQSPLSMIEDGEGAIWLSYYDSRAPFCRIKEGGVELVDAAAGLPGEYTTLLASDSLGQVWFARGAQVGVLRDNRLLPLLTQRQVVTAITGSRSGGVWFSDGGVIFRYREGGTPTEMGSVPSGKVNVLYEDRRGRLWVATDTNQSSAGLFLYDGKAFRQVPVVCPYILSLTDDVEDNLWVASRRQGLIQVRLKTIELVAPFKDKSGGLQSFCEDKGGNGFAVDVSGRLARRQGGIWNEVTSLPRGEEGYVECVAPDLISGVWVGTQRGLFRSQEGGFVRVGLTNGIGSAWIRAILVGSSGDVWVSTIMSQLYRLHDGQTERLELPANSEYVHVIVEDVNGTVWVASQKGRLLRVNGRTLVDQTPNTHETVSTIRCLHATPDGSLWIGYSSLGLGRLREGTFVLFGKEQGLLDKAVSQILSDGAGWLWCAGDHGIFRLKMEELEAVAKGKSSKIHPVWCGRGEGLPILQASNELWPRSQRCRSGELCMTLGAGLAVIQPERSIHIDPAPPVVVIERVSVNGQPVAGYESKIFDAKGTGSVPLVDLYGLKKPLSLGKGVHQVGIEYAVVTFKGQENVTFRYQLEGQDDTWVEAGPQRVAYFSMLPPGHYRFRVSACSNEGVWNKAGEVFSFSVEPYFWQTRWFQLLMWLVSGLLVGALVWMETWRYHRRRLLVLEAQQVSERERRRIAHDLHDELGSRLAKLSFMSELARDSADHPEEVRQRMDGIADTSRTALATLDEIVWAVNPKNDTLEHLAAYISEYVRQFFQMTPIECMVQIPIQLPACMLSAETRHHLFLAVQEALTNILKHAHATRVSVKMTLSEAVFKISVEDNGCGFIPPPPETREGGNGASSLVSRNGLGNMRWRLEQIGARFSLQTLTPGGTTVTFELKLTAV